MASHGEPAPGLRQPRRPRRPRPAQSPLPRTLFPFNALPSPSPAPGQSGCGGRTGVGEVAEEDVGGCRRVPRLAEEAGVGDVEGEGVGGAGLQAASPVGQEAGQLGIRSDIQLPQPTPPAAVLLRPPSVTLP